MMLQKKHILTTILFSAVALEPSFAEDSVATPADQQPVTTEQTASIQVEQQANLEKLQQVTQGIKLVFPEKLAEIYAARNFAPIWQDEKAKQLFLRDYALLGLTNISKDVKEQLAQLKQLDSNSLAADILITDSWLNYLNYAENVSSNAQNWLYDSYRYSAKLPKDELISAWLAAVAQQQLFAFVEKYNQPNQRYIHTAQAVVAGLQQQTLDNATLAKLAINLQRLRFIPDFHTGIFVNIPTYHLHYYRDGKEVLDSRVIVGKQARKTPVMTSKLSNIVVNPPWNAPVRLINEDLIPKVRKDPSYIYRNGYTIIDSKGNTIDPYTIDWDNMTAKRFPYRLRQAPGGDSALGNFKFNMPSSDAIYLHDTPNHRLFNNKNRAISSGCVRVNKSDELATLLLTESGWTVEKKAQVLKSRKTTSVRIQSDNPVYLYYVTAWVDAQGQMHTVADIYGYDKNLTLDDTTKTLLQQYLL
ncbi:L,D-transpeptidase family protein [Gallibacterium melopsittaci]|uniref:L,D-transpeptidase family protein n=1 Tax=Gallibacterium melopsittaci TaxID=516063 RepID=A0ABV6HX82_9PAST